MVKMLNLLLCLSLLVFVVHGAPYVCHNKYRPSNYIRSVHVPSSCSVSTPSSCPRSWKSGIPEGRATSKPLIYSEFITCHEGFASCGYVPINPKTGQVLGTSGVTIGAGVDLGSKSKNSPAFSSLSTFLVNKLEPYFGLRQGLAACAAIERPLILSMSNASNLTTAVKENFAETVAKRYDEDKERKALAFASLPRGIRTAIVSVWFQFGYPEAYSDFWNFVKKNDWEKAVNELRNFYKNPDEQLNGDLRRRNNEADIIDASLVKCNRSLDAVILLDESGSVPSQSFSESLDFVKNLVAAFPDEKLRGSDSTRFGLATFSTFYRSHFYLSSYTSQSEYQAAISNVGQAKRGTKLGRALYSVLSNQFTAFRGLRSEEYGLPRVLIVLTDGKASDDVSTPAQRVRNNNIVIYAIGIGNYDRPQLEAVASSPSHVYTLSTFIELETFIATITAATCNEPQPLSLNKTVKTTVTKNEYKYFRYNVDKKSNLEIKVFDLSGSSFVYASRSNPHPYKYDHDLRFDLSSQKNKIMVIAATSITNNTTRSTRDEDVKSIFVSVTAKTDGALFTIEGNRCNPLICTEGTNEVVNNGQSLNNNPSLFAFLLVIPCLLHFYC